MKKMVNLMALAAVLLMAQVQAAGLDFANAAVTDMNPGVLSAVTELEVTGQYPFLWYAAKPGTYCFYGNPDGDGDTEYSVTVKAAGFYRFKNPGVRFTIKLASAPIALWFGDGPVAYRPVHPGSKLWYAPPAWHVHLDEIPAENCRDYVEPTGCAFLSRDRFWHVAPFPAPSLKEVPKAKSSYTEKIEKVIAENAFAKAKSPRKVALFNEAFGYRHTGALEAGPEAFTLAGRKAGFEVETVADLRLLGNADFLAKFDAVILNSTTTVGEKNAPGVTKALTGYVGGGRGLVLLHAAVDAFYDEPEVQKMNGSLFWGHPWAAGGSWSMINEQTDNPINAPFRKLPVIMKFSDEIYQFATPPFNRGNCDVLVSMDMSDTLTAAAVDRWKSGWYGRDKWRADGDWVVSYTKRYGKGRVFYTSFGHDHRAFLDERLAHMVLGLQWTMGDLEIPARKPRPELKDRLWMWGHEPEAWNRYKEPFRRLGMEPAGHCSQPAGCRLMGIRRDCIIRWLSLPALPVSDEWCAEFRDLDEVAWSITDSDRKRTFLEKVDIAIAMKKRLPNLTTVFLDDYFQSHMRPLEELRTARDRVHAAGLKMAAVMYADVEGLRESDLASCELIDTIALWFWKPASFDTMEAQVRKAKDFLPKGKPLMLGLYMWDFGGAFGPVSGAKMKAQLAVAKRLLEEGTVEGLIFHPTMSADMDVPAVNLSKEWIRKLGE